MNTKVLEISACKLDSAFFPTIFRTRREKILSSFRIGELGNKATLESVKIALTNADN